MITKKELEFAYTPQEVREIFEYIEIMKRSETDFEKAFESAKTKDGQP